MDAGPWPLSIKIGPMKKSAPRQSSQTATTAFAATLALFLGLSFFPDQRVWGASVWAYLPIWSRLGLVAAGLVGLLTVRRLSLSGGDQSAGHTPTIPYWMAAALTVAGFGVLFILLRNTTHFLGDGYTLLANLSAQNPVMKGRNFGEHLVHLWLKKALGGDPKSAALLSFQIISVTAGLLFVTAAALAAARLYHALMDRLLFVLGLATGGYALMFFGYAENYSLLCLSIALFVLIGLLVSRDRIAKWWLVVPLGLTILCHSLGVTLIPAALYLLAQRTGLGDFLKERPEATKITLGIIVLLAGLGIFIQLYTTDYFFRFAFVPFVINRFTVEGYTALSGKHLADFLNLLILLFPGLIVATAMLTNIGLVAAVKRTEVRFLLLALIGTAGAMFVIDPKLGMPRDWDLFSIPGVPLVTLGMVLLLSSAAGGRRKAALLVVLLGFGTLIPRALTMNRPDMAVDQMKHYLKLDTQRSRTGWYLLSTFYLDHGDTASTQVTEKQREILYPEERMVFAATLMCRQGKCLEAKPTIDHVLAVNPQYADAWASLCTYYLMTGRFDSALICIRIADGLNPYNPAYLNDLGRAYSFVNDYDGAFRSWRLSSDIDSLNYAPVFNIARMFQVKGEKDKYVKYLEEASLRRDAPPHISREVAEAYIEMGDPGRAVEAFRRAIARGLDTAEVRKVTEKHPDLQEAL